MKKITNWKSWAKCAGVRAVKTVAQTAISVIGVSAVLSDVNWVAVALGKCTFGSSFAVDKCCRFA